jgi:hypothetical protein
MDGPSFSTAEEAVWAGFFIFGLCALWGLRLLMRGIRKETIDSSGHRTASRAWFIVGGILLSFPLLAFAWFAWQRGFFDG